MSGMPWDSSPQPCLFEAYWPKVMDGSLHDVVLQLPYVGCDTSLALVIPSGASCTVRGLTQDHHDSSSLITVFQAVASTSGCGLEFQVSSSSRVVAHVPPSIDECSRLVEFCAGMGASAIGLVAAGLKHVCAIEWQKSLVELHQQVHQSVPVIHGDIGKTDTLVALSEQVQGSFALMAGVSCQPYSRGGPEQVDQTQDHPLYLPPFVPVISSRCRSCSLNVSHLRGPMILWSRT